MNNKCTKKCYNSLELAVTIRLKKSITIVGKHYKPCWSFLFVERKYLQCIII